LERRVRLVPWSHGSAGSSPSGLWGHVVKHLRRSFDIYFRKSVNHPTKDSKVLVQFTTDALPVEAVEVFYSIAQGIDPFNGSALCHELIELCDSELVVSVFVNRHLPKLSGKQAFYKKSVSEHLFLLKGFP
jgi:hypothetical protein